jgi:hypothetical protein
MGVPTSEVGYTSATTGRGDHEVHNGHVVALAKKPSAFVDKFLHKPRWNVYFVWVWKVSHSLQNGHSLLVAIGERVLRNVFGIKREEVKRSFRTFHVEELCVLYEVVSKTSRTEAIAKCTTPYKHVSHTVYRCFALPQLLYRWRYQSGIFFMYPRILR